MVAIEVRFTAAVRGSHPWLRDGHLLASDRDEASLVAETGLGAVRHALMPLPATLGYFVFQQALGHLQPDFDREAGE
jgi:hypothetical protein